jgi:hypothetical protein
MPRKTQNETLGTWEGLVEACQANPKLRALFQREIQLLGQATKEARAALIRRDRLVSESQETTRKCLDVLARGGEMAIRIRSAVKGILGPRDERLIHFGIKPLKKRKGEVRRTMGRVGE